MSEPNKCNANFDEEITQFLSEAGYTSDDLPLEIVQANANFSYNLASIISNIKATFTQPYWKPVLDLILDKGLFIKCYNGRIFAGGGAPFVDKFN